MTLRLASALLLALTACGDFDSAPFEPTPGVDTDPGTTWDSSSTWDTSAPHDTDADTTPQAPPPETELDFELRTPEAGATFLYIPSTALDALIVVDARSLAIHLVEVGLGPTHVRALPEDQGAVVLNELSSELTLVRPTQESGQLTFETQAFPIQTGANRLVVAPDGSVAFAFHVSTPGSRGSLQDVSAVRISPGADPTTINLAVGLRPSEIRFADEGRLALILCEDGLSAVRLADLDGDTFIPPIPTRAEAVGRQTDRELVTTPDGAFALVRDLNTQGVMLVDLRAGALALLPLPDFASDLDLTRDGRTLLVPMIARQELALLTVPEAFTWTPTEPTEPTEPTDPAAEPPPANPFIRYIPTGAPFGSSVLTADERHALLYSTALNVTAIGRLDLASGDVALQPLPKAVAGVIPSPDARVAALLHHRGSGEGDLFNRPAYSLLDLATGYTKLVVTPHPLTDATFTDDASELFVLLPDPHGAAHQVDRAQTRTFAVSSYAVPFRPVYVGAMPSLSKVAIALDNPTGWITFIDTATGARTQLNSFELNSFID